MLGLQAESAYDLRKRQCYISSNWRGIYFVVLFKQQWNPPNCGKYTTNTIHSLMNIENTYIWYNFFVILKTQSGKPTFMKIYNFLENITRWSYALANDIMVHLLLKNNNVDDMAHTTFYSQLGWAHQLLLPSIFKQAEPLTLPMPSSSQASPSIWIPLSSPRNHFLIELYGMPTIKVICFPFLRPFGILSSCSRLNLIFQN